MNKAWDHAPFCGKCIKLTNKDTGKSIHGKAAFLILFTFLLCPPSH